MSEARAPAVLSEARLPSHVVDISVCEVTGTAFSVDGSCRVDVWNLRNGQKITTARAQPIDGLGNDDSDDEDADVGFVLCVGSSDGDSVLTVTAEGSLHIWRVVDSTLEQVRYTENPRARSIGCAAATPCLKYALTGERSGKVRFWDTRLAHTAAPHGSHHKGNVIAATFNQPGTRAVTVCTGRCVAIWQRKSGGSSHEKAQVNAGSGTPGSSVSAAAREVHINGATGSLGGEQQSVRFRIMVTAILPGDEVPRCAALTMCGTFACVGTATGALHYIDCNRGAIELSHEASTKPIQCISMNGDGSLVMVGTACTSTHPRTPGRRTPGKFTIWSMDRRRRPALTHVATRCLEAVPEHCYLQRPGMLCMTLTRGHTLQAFLLRNTGPWGARFRIHDMEKPLSLSMQADRGLCTSAQGMHLLAPMQWRNRMVPYSQLQGVLPDDQYAAQTGGAESLCALGPEARCAALAVGDTLYIASGNDSLQELGSCQWQRVDGVTTVRSLEFLGSDDLLVALDAHGSVFHIQPSTHTVTPVKALHNHTVRAIETASNMYAAQISERETMLVWPTGALATHPVRGQLLAFSDHYLCQLREPEGTMSQIFLALHSLVRRTGKSIPLRAKPLRASLAKDVMALLSQAGTIAMYDCIGLSVLKQLDAGCVPDSLALKGHSDGTLSCYVSGNTGLLVLRVQVARAKRRHTSSWHEGEQAGSPQRPSRRGSRGARGEDSSLDEGVDDMAEDQLMETEVGSNEDQTAPPARMLDLSEHHAGSTAIDQSLADKNPNVDRAIHATATNSSTSAHPSAKGHQRSPDQQSMIPSSDAAPGSSGAQTGQLIHRVEGLKMGGGSHL